MTVTVAPLTSLNIFCPFETSIEFGRSIETAALPDAASNLKLTVTIGLSPVTGLVAPRNTRRIPAVAESVREAAVYVPPSTTPRYCSWALLYVRKNCTELTAAVPLSDRTDNDTVAPWVADVAEGAIYMTTGA